MQIPGQVLWGIIGAIIGATLVAIIFIVIMFSRRRRALPEPEVKEAEVEVLPAAFQITDLLITPSQVKEGETVTVLAQVSNTGGKKGNYDVTLTVDGRVIGIKEVTLEPGSTTLVNFTLKETVGGEHIVEVDGLQGKFFIPPAKFTLSNLTITPDRVKEGEKITIAVEVTNDGGSTGRYLAELKVKGVTEMAQEIVLAPGASRTVTFITAKRKAGFYPIEIGDLSGKINVQMADFFERI